MRTLSLLCVLLLVLSVCVSAQPRSLPGQSCRIASAGGVQIDGGNGKQAWSAANGNCIKPEDNLDRCCGEAKANDGCTTGLCCPEIYRDVNGFRQSQKCSAFWGLYQAQPNRCVFSRLLPMFEGFQSPIVADIYKAHGYCAKSVADCAAAANGKPAVDVKPFQGSQCPAGYNTCCEQLKDKWVQPEAPAGWTPPAGAIACTAEVMKEGWTAFRTFKGFCTGGAKCTYLAADGKPKNFGLSGVKTPAQGCPGAFGVCCPVTDYIEALKYTAAQEQANKPAPKPTSLPGAVVPAGQCIAKDPLGSGKMKIGACGPCVGSVSTVLPPASGSNCLNKATECCYKSIFSAPIFDAASAAAPAAAAAAGADSAVPTNLQVKSCFASQWVTYKDPNSADKWFTNLSTGASSWDKPTSPVDVTGYCIPKKFIGQLCKSQGTNFDISNCKSAEEACCPYTDVRMTNDAGEKTVCPLPSTSFLEMEVEVDMHMEDEMEDELETEVEDEIDADAESESDASPKKAKAAPKASGKAGKAAKAAKAAPAASKAASAKSSFTSFQKALKLAKQCDPDRIKYLQAKASKGDKKAQAALDKVRKQIKSKRPSAPKSPAKGKTAVKAGKRVN